MENAFRTPRNGLVKRSNVAFNGEPAKVPSAELSRRPQRRKTAATCGDPEVNVVRGTDGSIQAISIHCTCGRDITLQCEYLGEGGRNEQTGS